MRHHLPRYRVLLFILYADRRREHYRFPISGGLLASGFSVSRCAMHVLDCGQSSEDLHVGLFLGRFELGELLLVLGHDVPSPRDERAVERRLL